MEEAGYAVASPAPSDVRRRRLRSLAAGVVTFAVVVTGGLIVVADDDPPCRARPNPARPNRPPRSRRRRRARGSGRPDASRSGSRRDERVPGVGSAGRDGPVSDPPLRGLPRREAGWSAHPPEVRRHRPPVRHQLSVLGRGGGRAGPGLAPDPAFGHHEGAAADGGAAVGLVRRHRVRVERDGAGRARFVSHPITWSLAPLCPDRACDVSFTATHRFGSGAVVTSGVLVWSGGATYSGTWVGSFGSTCARRRLQAVSTLTITMRATSARVVGGLWVASGIGGSIHERVRGCGGVPSATYDF